MKVHIGPYKDWFGPYQLAQKLCFWAKPVIDEFEMESPPDWVHNFGEWLAHGSVLKEDEGRPFRDDRPYTWLYKFLEWIHRKKKRKVVVKIDSWDTWNMDGTLALIILPMLKQLKSTTHGSCQVDNDDVPDHLKSTSDGDDPLIHKRWEWVLDEMIWTFEQLHPDCDWEKQYQSGEMDWQFIPISDKDGRKLYQTVNGPNHTFDIDMVGMDAHNDRINNGLRLFGKYYRGLWD